MTAAADHHARVRRPDLSRLYRRQLSALDVDALEYRTTLLRPRGIRPHEARIDHLIQSLSWNWVEGDPVLHGSLAMEPRGSWGGVRVSEGDTLRLDSLWFGRWTEVWRMTLADDQDQLASGVTFALDDPLGVLQQSRDDWHYSKSKKGGHPNGWRADQIVRDVARRYRIPLGRVARGQRQIHSLSYDGYSPLQIIQRAYALEKASTGHRFVIRWVNGRLCVLPMRRNPLLYVMEGQIVDGLLAKTERGDGFATAMTARATVKHGKKTKKIVVRASDADAVRKYGFVHQNAPGLGDVKDEGDAREKLRRKLNKVAQRKRVVTGLEHPLIPFVVRGDAIEARIPSRGMTGAKAIGFVSAGTWTLSGGSGTMSLDMTFDDPYATTAAQRQAQDKAARAKKRAQHAAAAKAAGGA